jgi:hypothetical protein
MIEPVLYISEALQWACIVFFAWEIKRYKDSFKE